MDRFERVAIHFVDTAEAVIKLGDAGCHAYYVNPIEGEPRVEFMVKETESGYVFNRDWRDYLETYRSRIVDLATVLMEDNRQYGWIEFTSALRQALAIKNRASLSA